MILKTIVLILDDSVEGENRLRYAVNLAKINQAHLTGILITPTSWSATNAQKYAVGKESISGMLAHFEKTGTRLIEHLHHEFEHLTHQIDASFILINDFEADKKIHCHLLYTDLIIWGNNGINGLPANLLADTLLLATGIPLIILPPDYKWVEKARGDNILIGWNGSREARRALTDSFSLLEKAYSVSVIEVFSDDLKMAQEKQLDDHFLAYLAKHQIKNVHLKSLSSQGQLVTPILLDYIDKNSIELLIIGAYSKPRTVEILFGGVTRSLLKSIKIPLLITN